MSRRRPPYLLRLLRFYLFRFDVLGYPLAFYLLGGAIVWGAAWLNGGRL